jgi:hypothetical protein
LYAPSIAAAAEKAQHDPHEETWSLTALTAPSALQSFEAIRFDSSSLVGSNS